jgi:hypothetical protein
VVHRRAFPTLLRAFLRTQEAVIKGRIAGSVGMSVPGPDCVKTRMLGFDSRLAHEGQAMLGSPRSNHQRPEC